MRFEYAHYEFSRSWENTFFTDESSVLLFRNTQGTWTASFALKSKNFNYGMRRNFQKWKNKINDNGSGTKIKRRKLH